MQTSLFWMSQVSTQTWTTINHLFQIWELQIWQYLNIGSRYFNVKHCKFFNHSTYVLFWPKYVYITLTIIFPPLMKDNVKTCSKLQWILKLLASMNTWKEYFQLGMIYKRIGLSWKHFCCNHRFEKNKNGCSRHMCMFVLEISFLTRHDNLCKHMAYMYNSI